MDTIEYNKNYYKDLLNGFSDRMIATMIAINNTIQYKIAYGCGAIGDKDKKGRRTYNHSAYDKIFSKTTFHGLTMKGFCTIIKKWYKNFCYVSKTRIQEARKVLAEVFDIFHLEQRDWSNPKNRNREAATITGFAAAASAVFGKAAEEVLLERGYELEGEGDKCFPSHKCYNSVAFYRMATETLAAIAEEIAEEEEVDTDDEDDDDDDYDDYDYDEDYDDDDGDRQDDRQVERQYEISVLLDVEMDYEEMYEGSVQDENAYLKSLEGRDRNGSGILIKKPSTPPPVEKVTPPTPEDDWWRRKNKFEEDLLWG